MTYAIIDRRNAKLVKVALKKKDLPKGVKGLIIDTNHMEELSTPELIQAYRAIKKEEFNGRVTPKVREELAEILDQKAQRANVSRSTVESPVATVWGICDKMKGSPRKDIIAAAVKAGVTEGTAKTQYQYWKTWSEAQKSTKKNSDH